MKKDFVRAAGLSQQLFLFKNAFTIMNKQIRNYRHHRPRGPRQNHPRGHHARQSAFFAPMRLSSSASWTPATSSASAASPFSPRIPLSFSTTPRSISWTRLATAILAVKSNAPPHGRRRRPPRRCQRRPAPANRYVLQKALAAKLPPVVVLNRSTAPTLVPKKS